MATGPSIKPIKTSGRPLVRSMTGVRFTNSKAGRGFVELAKARFSKTSDCTASRALAITEIQRCQVHLAAPHALLGAEADFSCRGL
jgi:hypothetical protein